jgi:hypothetical protein
MGFLGKAVMFLGGSEILYALHILFGDSGYDGSSAPHFAIGVVLVIIGGTLLNAAQAQVARGREQRAKQIATLLQAGKEVPPFSLYLRPFSTTAKLQVSNPDPNTIGATPAALYTPRTLELENRLAAALENFAPLVALGKPDLLLGAGKITVEDKDWQEQLKVLVAAAKVICVVPEYQEGTLWEIRYLKNTGYFDRTVFVMPHRVDVGKAPRIDVARIWADTSYALIGSGVTLPPYSDEGLLFSLNRQGEISRSAKTSKWLIGSRKLLLESIRSVIPEAIRKTA